MATFHADRDGFDPSAGVRLAVRPLVRSVLECAGRLEGNQPSAR